MQNKAVFKFLVAVLVFDITALLILGGWQGFKYAKYQYENLNEQKRIDQVALTPTLTPTPSPMPTPTTSPVGPDLSKGVFQSEKLQNQLQTKAFYFTSPADISKLKLNSEQSCYNGDAIYYIDNPNNERIQMMRTAEYLSRIIPQVEDLKTHQVKEVKKLGQDFAYNGCTNVAGWVDDNTLIENVAYGDISAHRVTYLIDVTANTRKLLARWDITPSGYVDPAAMNAAEIQKKNQEESAGMYVTAQIYDFESQQFCPNENECGDLFIKNTDGKIVGQIKNPIQFSAIDFSSQENFNVKNLGKKVQLKLGSYEYIFDVENGMLL